MFSLYGIYGSISAQRMPLMPRHCLFSAFQLRLLPAYAILKPAAAFDAYAAASFAIFAVRQPV